MPQNNPGGSVDVRQKSEVMNRFAVFFASFHDIYSNFSSNFCCLTRKIMRFGDFQTPSDLDKCEMTNSSLKPNYSMLKHICESGILIMGKKYRKKLR
jgi:hypothetical protein